MEMKKVWAMYFSPTGGTEKVVKGTAEALAEVEKQLKEKREAAVEA